MKIAIINGPNLNLLGTREPEVYGHDNFDDYLDKLKQKFPTVEFNYFQSNIEGEIIDYLHKVGFDAAGIIINAGGYTHTSVAIGDALAAITSPAVEVHISNVYSRENFRHQSYLSNHCSGVIVGLGLYGYEAALLFLMQNEN